MECWVISGLGGIIRTGFWLRRSAGDSVAKLLPRTKESGTTAGFLGLAPQCLMLPALLLVSSTPAAFVLP